MICQSIDTFLSDQPNGDPGRRKQHPRVTCMTTSQTSSNMQATKSRLNTLLYLGEVDARLFKCATAWCTAVVVSATNDELGSGSARQRMHVSQHYRENGNQESQQQNANRLEAPW
jgi:hypothetical protein